MLTTDLDTLSINTIRTLAMDAVQQANSGHPGTPMAMAPVAYALWQRHLRFDPDDPIWPDRDRFVLSMGHASMLLYSMLHLAGVKAVNPKYETLGQLSVGLDDIKHFRQLESRCPGHPEYRWTSGIETTTGPLGQGVATSVGMAIAAKWMAAHFNRPDFPMFDFDVYALAGDGCMMEGISSRSGVARRASAARQPGWIYDNNRITIEGRTSLAFSEDVATRFICVRLERHARRRRQRSGDARSRVRDVQEDDRPAHADHRRQPHRLRRADQAGHARRARRAARRRGDPRGEAILRLAGGREVPRCPTACASISPPASARAARQLRKAMDGAVRGLQGEVSRRGRRAVSHAAPAAARRAGSRRSRLSRRSERARRPRRVGQGPQRRGAAAFRG